MYAEFTGTAAAAYTTSGKCAATFYDGTASGPMSLKPAVTAGASATFKCLYPTTIVQASYQRCRGGGLQTAYTTGCINPALAITITEAGKAMTTIAAGTNPDDYNKAGRTFQGFATTSTVTSKMYLGRAGCPYTTFMDFYTTRRSGLSTSGSSPRSTRPPSHTRMAGPISARPLAPTFTRASTRSRRAPPT